MKAEYTLDLSAITDLSNFCTQLNAETRSDVLAHGKRPFNYEVDARSFLGLSSVTRDVVTIRILSDDDAELQRFAAICEKYEIKEK